MQIHELNDYTGSLADAYMAVDNSSDTGRKKIKDITDPLDTRIDNIIAGGAAPSEAEIIDARLGADGITYPSLGDAIRGQIDDLQNDLLNMGYDKTSTAYTPINHTNGRYWTGNNSWGYNANYFVSQRFQLLKGQKLKYSAYGETGVYMLVECDQYYNEIQSGAHIAFSSNLTTPLTGEYTATKDMWVSLSVNQTKTNNYAIIEIDYDVLDDIAELKDVTANISETITPTYTTTQDKYINSSGVVSDSTNYCYTSPIKLEAGEVLKLIGTGYQTSVAMVSTCDIGGGNITPVVISATGVTEYEYIATDNVYVILSYNYSVTHSVSIIRNIIDVLENQINNATPDYMLMFQNIGIVGDSLSSGELAYNEGGTNHYVDIYTGSWLANICRITGATPTYYSQGGMTSKAWIEDSGGYKTQMQTDGAKNAYYLALGTNDISEAYPIGNISDAAGINSFVGYMRSIIEYIHGIAVYAPIFLVSTYNDSANGITYSNMIKSISALYSYCYYVDYIDNATIYTSTGGVWSNLGHFTSVGYVKVAETIKKLTNSIVSDNISDFKFYTLHN